MGDSSDGVVVWVGSFHQDGDKMFSHRTAHLPHHHYHKTNKMQDCHNVARTGSTDTTIQWHHRYIQTGWQAAAGAGGGTAASRSTLALWAGLRQCLLVIIHFTQGGEETPRTGLKGPEGGSERGGTLSWLDVCRRLGATTFTHGQSMGQVELDSCRVAGWGSRGPGERSTACTQCGIL